MITPIQAYLMLIKKASVDFLAFSCLSILLIGIASLMIFFIIFTVDYMLLRATCIAFLIPYIYGVILIKTKGF